MRLLKYVLAILVIALVWNLIREFVINNRQDEPRSFQQKLWDAGRRIHWGVGVAAGLIMITILIRFLLQALRLL